ncbi:MAG: tryptophan--tRNA ligase [Mycoplasmataceae bacterium]|nr:tryptophan--tRNA ligase [Mycoplasmataceae bacterium]
MKTLISGIQPTNRLTIGNYLGAIKQFVNYQNKYKMYIFVADLHALTNKYDTDKLSDNKFKIIASYIASGLDIKKNVVFYQADVPAHCQLNWILTCNATMGELNRMTQFKDKTMKMVQANGTNSIPTGLFTYPILMAADIMLYDADYVPVGIDQKQHVELTRNLVDRMNNKYGKLFKQPQPLIPEFGAKIMDLLNPTMKMSKSNENEKGTIFLLDKLDEVTRKIMGAKTDSLNKVKYDLINQPGISNLLTIYSCLTNKKIGLLEKNYANKNYGEFKKDIAEVICNFLKNFQNKFDKAIKNKKQIEKTLKDNAKKCIQITDKKITNIYKAVGLTK